MSSQDLGSIPGTHIGEGEGSLPIAVLLPLHAQRGKYTHIHTHGHKVIYNTILKFPFFSSLTKFALLWF